MKFPHNPKFNAQFDQIPGLVWYPYVGQDFEQSAQRIMVFAHNIPMDEENYEAKTREWTAKATWADALEEYTYEQARYTKAFRSFIKGALGLDENYGYESNPSVINKVDAFVTRIAYGNFIQGLVKSNSALATADWDTVTRSKAINRPILEILGITHCICWGKNVFDYITTSEGFDTLQHEDLNKGGFAQSLIENEQGHKMRVLKIYHPSMPSFGHKTTETHSILSTFLSTPNP